MRSFLLLCGGWLIAVLAGPANAAEITAAVAANFISPFREIATQFERTTGHRLRVVSGSSGNFYTQITNGAPFDVFFSADQERPRLLEEEGAGVNGSRFTYAIGRLVLWSPDPQLVVGEYTLHDGRFKHLAIANPQVAPYGVAAKQVMIKLGLWDQLQPRIVQGESLGQTMGFITSGNAALGFIALSQAEDPALRQTGSRWDIPPHLYDPINQDVVLLTKGRSNPGAEALLVYVRGADARRIIKRFGYALK